MMYHDVEYESWEEAKNEYLQKRKVECSTQENAKRTKHVSVTKDDEHKLPAGADSKKALLPKQTARLAKIIEDLSKKNNN